jgi:propanol-preferring alcohol dehydrogenase
VVKSLLWVIITAELRICGGPMKAARFYGVNQLLRIEEIPMPSAGPDDVLVGIKAAGICGSDLHIVYEGTATAGFIPITLGHEASGIVAEVGTNVTGWKTGDRVVVDSLISCGSCYNCRVGRESVCSHGKFLGIHLDGAFAEFIIVPSKNLLGLPDNIPFDQGAAIADAVATPYHAIIKIGRLRMGETVAVIGCGGLGIHAVQLCRIGGASKIIAVDLDDEILQRARKAGATDSINIKTENASRRAKEITSGLGVDMALEFVGHAETITTGIRLLRNGGRLVVSGIGPERITLPPPSLFVWKELSLLGAFGFDRDDIAKPIELAEAGMLDLSGSITETFPLEEVNIALEHLRDKIGKPVRIMIVP